MCLLLETICIRDGVLMNPEWHRRRMGQACRELWNRDFPGDLAAIIRVPPKLASGKVRCRIIYGLSVREVSFSIYTPRAIRSLKLVDGGAVDYHLKYEDRRQLDSLFALRGSCDDVIIVRNGLITDTSLSNLVFYDGRSWSTPATPLLKGTCRARLLAAGVIAEADIRPENLDQYAGCKLINSMRDPGEEEMIPVSEIFR